MGRDKSLECAVSEWTALKAKIANVKLRRDKCKANEGGKTPAEVAVLLQEFDQQIKDVSPPFSPGNLLLKTSG